MYRHPAASRRGSSREAQCDPIREMQAARQRGKDEDRHPNGVLEIARRHSRNRAMASPGIKSSPWGTAGRLACFGAHEPTQRSSDQQDAVNVKSTMKIKSHAGRDQAAADHTIVRRCDEIKQND